ncbi:MAG: 50S ribosomal protein L3 [Candidatus Latescibacterota bacterium]|nr:MAG: 50S ribosomal protein L3 [Candidatus Latescibacterota bacterium]
MQLLIGKKLGMTQVFEESGGLTPVSVIQAGPCPIVQVKTTEMDGYSAIQIGFGEGKENRVRKPLKGHYKRGGVSPCRILKEVRVDDPGQFKVGEALDVKIFEGAERVHVAGVSKGRGFAGTVRRYNFKKGPVTHGSKNIREPGSVGMCATPSRIFKGKRLPGRMGGRRTTVRNLRLVQIDAENNLLYVKGAVPGANNGIVLIRRA